MNEPYLALDTWLEEFLYSWVFGDMFQVKVEG
jgi:hypothetical protein